ncbi:hypothetical protein DL98DRAFT_655617 [Cadophora sp. DSE1049]|nr:hypothetical protein DL98DRAFT_655617 [Cadophora sp. DSE1049]
MFNPTNLLTISLWAILALTIPSLAHPSPFNTTSILDARFDPCICTVEGRFCVGISSPIGLSGICPADTIITCKKKNIGKEPNQKQYCTHSWPSTGKGTCYWKESSGKLKCK